jgi:2-polyprenyl-3-methyl-5-hydroxy-6-metoxy-1,4-benzoquinol methylase
MTDDHKAKLAKVQTVVPWLDQMPDASHTDRRFSQTQDRYAADDLETMQEARRYAAHIFGLMRPFVGARVLEVGAGIGTMTSRLVEVADFVLGIEPNPNCVARIQELMRSHPRFTLRTCHFEECDPTELASLRFDSVLCVNVLEHIADDAGALTAFKQLLVPGGRVLVFVPAVQAAYGPLDAELGHHRRYSKRTLRAAFEAAGLELTRLRYTNPIGLAGWIYNARISKSTAHSLSQVKLFERLVAPWALPLERLVPPPIGLSLVAVGAKRGN